MKYTLKKRIGKPELLSGKTGELSYFLKWINGIKEEKSNSTAVMAQRKVGKIAREAPRNMAFRQKEFIVQMLDEFQYMNAVIYRDKNLNKLMDGLAGVYLSTAAGWIASLPVTGKSGGLDVE